MIMREFGRLNPGGLVEAEVKKLFVTVSYKLIISEPHLEHQRKLTPLYILEFGHHQHVPPDVLSIVISILNN
jgi:hypothetical protein